MPKRIRLHPHLTEVELCARYRHTCDPVERSRWHFLWLLARGLTAAAVARTTGYSAYWIGQVAQRYNCDGAEGVRDRRHRPGTAAALLSAGQCEELRQALAGPAPDGERWCGRTVAAWIGLRVARRICRQVGWAYLRRLGPAGVCPGRATPVPTLRRSRTSRTACARCCDRSPSPFPTATVELWAVDEHRIGLKPILRKVWTLEEPRPLAPVQHRFAWRYLVGFVHPASGRAVFHLASSVSIALFEVELAAFAREVGAWPERQIVRVLDRAGWHASVRLKAPEHIHLLFLPLYSPELQPAEHLWPLTNDALINRHFATIEELEDAQFARCVALQARPDLIRSTTRFHWWPQRIKKRLGPRRN